MYCLLLAQRIIVKFFRYVYLPIEFLLENLIFKLIFFMQFFLVSFYVIPFLFEFSVDENSINKIFENTSTMKLVLD